MDDIQLNLSHIQQSTLDLNQVFGLIDTLYNSKNPDDQAEANRRLTQLQESDQAWEICWPLLDTSRCQSVEAHFFAANALVLKINQSWSQQSEQWLEKELRPKLLEVLLKYASSPGAGRLVIERLSLALATFALHSIPTFWPDAIENILQTFTPQNLSVNISPQRICDILLKILMYIPEEYSVLLPQQEHKAKLNFQITKSGPNVFKFLHSLLIADNSVVSSDCKQSVLKCLTSWTIHSNTSLLEIEGGKVFLDKLYDLIADEELCSHACATLGATFNTQKADHFRNSVIEFIPKIASLQPLINKYIEQDDIESAIKIYSLVINFSENHSRLFLKIVLNDGVDFENAQKHDMSKQSIFAIIKIILHCTSAPGIYGVDEKYSDTAFTFWFSFLENFYYYSESFNDLLCETFDPLVDNLLQILIAKSRFPTAEVYYNSWNDDQRESYRCYRQDIGDNISLLVYFPRSRDRILEQLSNSLLQELNKLLQPSDPNTSMSWQNFESIVFAVKSVSESVPFDEDKYMPKIFNAYTQIRFYQFPSLLYCTVAEMISSYSDWLFSNHEHLGISFEILFFGVTSSDPHVRLMSTLSLKDVTTECQTVLKPYATRIVESCSKAIFETNFNLSTNEKSRLMYTIGTTLAMCTSDQISQSIQNLTLPLVSELASKAPLDPRLDPTCRPIIYERMTMLNSLIESLYVKQSSGHDYEDGDENNARLFDTLEDDEAVELTQPSLNLLRQLVPILIVVATKYRQDEEIMKIISNTIKRSSKSLGIEVKPIVKDFLVIIVNAYDPYYNSSILEGCVPLYKLFKIDKSLHQCMKDAFFRISEKTIEVCVANPLGQLPSTLENYFRYSTLVCKKFSEFLTETTSGNNVELIYKLGIASLELPEKRTLSEVCNFLVQFKQKSVGVKHLHKIFADNLNQMLCNIFCLFGGNYATARNATDHVAELLHTVVNTDEAKEPLRLIVERDEFPTKFVNRHQKARFISKIVHEKNLRKFKEACSEFVILARNLNRSS